MLNIAGTLRALLEADLDSARATARRDYHRAQLSTLYANRYAEDGAAPSGKVNGLGRARWDTFEPSPAVIDGAAFGSWVAERYPDHVTTTIQVRPDQLAQALQALQFAGVEVLKADATVPSAMSADILKDAVSGAEMDDDPKSTWLPDRASGAFEQVPGVQMITKNPRLVVTLDQGAKRDALATIEAALEREQAEADVPVVDLTDHDKAVVVSDESLSEVAADPMSVVMLEQRKSVSTDPFADATIDPYVDWTVGELRRAVRARDLGDYRGTKNALRTKLMDDDRMKEQD